MAIASSIFWIVVGILYIVYQLFKARPAETLSGIIAFVIILAGGYLFLSATNMLGEVVHPLLGILVELGVTITLLVLLLRYRRKKNEELLQSLKNREHNNENNDESEA